jgi:hypothetical protein
VCYGKPVTNLLRLTFPTGVLLRVVQAEVGGPSVQRQLLEYCKDSRYDEVREEAARSLEAVEAQSLSHRMGRATML